MSRTSAQLLTVAQTANAARSEGGHHQAANPGAKDSIRQTWPGCSDSSGAVEGLMGSGLPASDRPNMKPISIRRSCW